MSVTFMSKEDLETALTGEERPILVDFWEGWCTYCRRLDPAFEEAAAEMEPELMAVQVDVDQEPELAERYHIDTIPTLLLFRNGQPEARITAPDSKAELLEFLRSSLS